MEEKFLEIHQPAAGFPIVGGPGGGGRSTPHSMIFFGPLPIKTNAPHGAHPPHKNEAPPTEK